MRKYDEYKDSGSNLIGKIPANWEICRFGSVFRLKPVVPHHNEELLSVFLEYGVIPASESEKRTHKPSEDLSKYQLVEKTDFVMNNQQAWRGSVGVSRYVGIISPAYHIFKMPRQLDASYANYLLRDKCMVGHYEMSSKGVGSIQRTLNFNWLNNGFLIIPPISEQRIIASFLNNKSREIDNLISKTEREIELLKELKQSVVAHVVTKGLNPNAKMKDSGIGWIGEIPEHWEVKRLASAFVENREQNAVLSYTNAYKFNYGSIVPKENEGKIAELSDIYKKYTVIHPGDIILNGLNLNYDFVSQRVAMSYDTGIITSAYLSITPRGGKMPSYHLHLLKTMDAKKLFHGIGTGIRLTMGYDELKKQMLLFPPIDEQQEIVEYIDYKTTQIDKMIVELTYKVECLKQYKQRLIADVVTGKINVQPE